jgi:uncharacterized lipoprotein YajG
MTSLKHKLVAAFSVLVILVAVVVLPGCKKQTPAKAPTKKATADKALKDME